jgi:mediator of RNA polymerase II transcription subunit 12
VRPDIWQFNATNEQQVTTSEQAESLQQLDVRLSCFIKRLARDHTSSMVLSNSWNRYKDLVPSCLNLKDSVDKAILHSLVERNVRVYRPQDWQQTAQPTPRQRIIRLLDVKQRALDIPSVSATCLDAVEDRRALVSSVLEWSATPFRSGLYRVYASVRLLRKWKRCGIDVDSHILSFLTEARGRATLNMDNVYHAVSELVRSQTFSVGRYLQWLMAKGLADSSQLDQQKVICRPMLFCR